MNQYGAWVGREGEAQPFPKYQQISAEDARRLPPPDKAYMRGFKKDFDSYFAGPVTERPTPTDAGYWPYPIDGLDARGDAGSAGSLLRSWESMEEMPADSPIEPEGGKRGASPLSMDQYLDAEMTGAYTDDMKFYTDDN